MHVGLQLLLQRTTRLLLCILIDLLQSTSWHAAHYRLCKFWSESRGRHGVTACCRLLHSFATFLSLACAFSPCMSFFLALRSRALIPSRSPTLSPSRSLLLLFLSFSHLFLLSFSFSHSLSLSLWRKIEFSTNWKRSLLLRQRCQLALRGRRSEFRRAKKGLKKCHHIRTYQTETVLKAKPCQKWTCLKSEPVSKAKPCQKWNCRNSEAVSNCLKSETMK